MSRIAGYTVLITGASAGIGAACATEFAKHDVRLVLAARRMDKLAEVEALVKAEKPSAEVRCLSLDLLNPEQIEKALSTLPAEFQKIDILVNNAGLVIGLDKVEHIPLDRINTILDTNVKGLILMTQAVMPGMRERQRGHIINIGSTSGKEVYPGGGVYCASKHAVDAITRTLRYELYDTPLRVTAIEPGLVNTEFSTVRFSGKKDQADKVYEGFVPLVGQDIAEAVVFAATRPLHVQVAHLMVMPSAQATGTAIYRGDKK